MMCPGKHADRIKERGTPGPAFSILFRDPHMTTCAHTAKAPTELYLPPNLTATKRNSTSSAHLQKGVILLVHHSLHRMAILPAPPLPGLSHIPALLFLNRSLL